MRILLLQPSNFKSEGLTLKIRRKKYDEFIKKVKRHEIIHAYFHESGLKTYAENEELVDWMAWQFPKLLATFKEIDAL